MAGIKLQKRAEQVGIILAKRGITKVPPVRVGMALDVSGSAQGFYTSGVMQETIDRLLGVALKFDDNGELDSWLFHDGVLPKLPTLTESDEGTYVNNVILKQRGLWGATEYAPVLKATQEFYFSEKKGGLFGFGKKTSGSKDPAMVLFVTDGANSDEYAAAQVLREAAKNSPVYFNMVGIGPSSHFGFIKRMADELPNVGFVNLSSLSMTDDQLYEQLINPEFCEWIKTLKV